MDWVYTQDAEASWWIVIFTLAAFFLTYGYYEKTRYYNARQIITYHTSEGLLWGLAIILALFIGYRPVFTSLFGDSMGYGLGYINYNPWEEHAVGNRGLHDKWFRVFTAYCYKFLDVHGYFTAIATVYFLFAAWACKMIYKGQGYTAFLMYFGAFSTFSYVTNGLRSGMAASIVILGMGILLSKKGWLKVLVAVGLFYCATQFHNSSKLTGLAVLGGYFLSRWRGAPKWVFAYYLLCFVLYFTMHSTIEAMLSDISFDNDDRYSAYLSDDTDSGYYSGFRPDFILYSIMPIILGWYVIFRKKVRNKTFEALLYAYILANGVWITLIEASFSNRFAYLSWCIYPFVMAYPCLRMNVWGRDQGKDGGYIVMANVGFTAFMMLIYYNAIGGLISHW